MLKKLKQSKIKIITILSSLFLALFILVLITCVVTHTTLPALITSILSEEIQFAINPRYEHVAETLGCTEAQAFWRVTLPMSKNGLLAGSIITWSKGIGEFGAALMVAGATRIKTETLPISLFLNMSCGELNLAIAAATILIIISLISLFVFERYGGFTRVF